MDFAKPRRFAAPFRKPLFLIPCKYQQEGVLLWMDEILHHFETMGNHCSSVFTGESLFYVGFLGWCRISFIHSLVSIWCERISSIHSMCQSRGDPPPPPKKQNGVGFKSRSTRFVDLLGTPRLMLKLKIGTPARNPTKALPSLSSASLKQGILDQREQCN